MKSTTTYNDTVTEVDFSLTLNKTTVDLKLPSSLLPYATSQRDDFLSSTFCSLFDNEIDGQESQAQFPLLAVELITRFINYLGSQGADQQQERLIEILRTHLETILLNQTNIHTVAATQLHDQDLARQRSLIRTYYAATTYPPKTRSSAGRLRLVDGEGGRTILTLFGGQGNNKAYFDELRSVWETYRPLVGDLIDVLSDTLKTLSRGLHAADQEDIDDIADQYRPHGLDPAHWLRHPEDTPPTEYLVSAAVSFPLIGLLQLAHFRAVSLCLGGGGGGACFSGHSQGVVVAAVLSTISLSSSSSPPNDQQEKESFLRASQTALKILFAIGSRSQQIYSASRDPLSKSLAEKLETEYGLGKPSPMLSVSSSTSGGGGKVLSRRQLEKLIVQTNRLLPKEKHVSLGLINAESPVHTNFVVSGPERTLAALVQNLRAVSVTTEAGPSAQARVPFSQRKPVLAMRFLPITVPCHCPLLDAAVPLIEADLQRLNVSIARDELKVSVNQLINLEESGDEQGGNIVPLLVKMITSRPVDWVRENDAQQLVEERGITHIIDFGPGLNSGVGALTHRNLVGRGVRVLVAGKLSSSSSTSDLGTLSELFEARPATTTKWSVFSPQLVRTFSASGASSTPIIATRFSRLLRGLPPVMVAGMTPTTTSPSFVAAVMNAGYHVEFACGAYHSPSSLRTALAQLHSLIPLGRSIALNVIYVAPKQIAWQIPLIKALRSEGIPISSVTVGGGVPSVEVATGWIDDLGVEFLSFKPGSVGGIRQVVDIAKSRPAFPIVLQWTGGRGGGHHSAEDMYAPILETYGEIRGCGNIALVAGSGLGSAEDVTPWFTGDWVVQTSGGGGGMVKMPFDGVLLGSRVMATREAATSPGAKQQIAAAPGVEDAFWEGTYKGVTGGILSVVSEMGERIHVVATRGARFWSEMDRTVFSVDRKKRGAVLEKNRAAIIKGLNADFQKVWFGRKMDGTEDCDVADMTYEEVARRLVQLMFVLPSGGDRKATTGRWIDRSYAGFLTAFLERLEERLGDQEEEESVVSADECLDDPLRAVEAVLRACPLATTALLCSEDVDYFFQLCRRPGQKPVPFVPALDDHFETWFKKDSLWQSEDVEAVVDQDAGRTFILHGPVAARHTCKVNEPVGEVLGGINRGVVEHLMQGIDFSSLPYEEMIAPRQEQHDNQNVDNEALVDLSGLSGDTLRRALAGTSTWKRALLDTRSILRGRDMVDNPVRRMFETAGCFDSATAQVDNPDSITILTHDSDSMDKRTLLEITRNASSNNNVIEVRPYTYTTRGNQPVSMLLKFEYRPDTPYAPIREVMEHRNERICAMYRQLWQGGESTTLATEDSKGPEFSVFEDTFTVDASRVRALNRAIGYSSGTHQHESVVPVPMDFAMVVCWSPICRALLQDPIQGDVLNLVHLSNAYEVHAATAAAAGPLLQVGDCLATRAYVNSITIEQDSGKAVEVICEVLRQRQLIMTVRSKFLFRGHVSDDSYPSTFARRKEPVYELHMSSEADIAVLAAKPWFRLDNQNGNTLDHLNLTDLTLEFHLETVTRWLSKSVCSTIDTTGRAYIRSDETGGQLTPVASILHRDFECRSNSVTSYLSRWGQIVSSEKQHPVGASSSSEQTTFSIQIPASNESYSLASGDFNPIHTSPLFVSLVSLPGTITHGMYLSAAVRRLVETHLAGSNPARILSYSVSFTGMVLPNDNLSLSVSHTAMQRGHLVLSLSVTNPTTSARVLTGQAVIAQPSTTLVFTGQGSQEKGMGMSLYQTSPVARGIWDRAEAYFQSTFGLSILQIVRDNPKSITVRFGGVKGRVLRQNYLSMYYEVPASSSSSSTSTNQPVRKPIFPDITPTSTSYTHSSPNGLLFATQFAQPALTIAEMAMYRDLQARGVVAPDAKFAGHSLGEYAALLSIADFMPFENLLYFVFWRGMTMQSAVERDLRGRSRFAMVAVDPSRVSRTLREDQLRDLVARVSRVSGWFVEIVNLNIRDRQYVCAGDLRALDLLQKLCDSLASSMSSTDSQTISTELLITKLAARYQDRQPEEIELVRGKATVPLAGVDVPFHSSLLRPRIDAFRRTLQDSLSAERIRPETLVGKYVPNVTGTPFQLDRDYMETVARITGSERLTREVLECWDDWEGRIRMQRGIVATAVELAA